VIGPIASDGRGQRVVFVAVDGATAGLLGVVDADV
jgi:hypothetical protein